MTQTPIPLQWGQRIRAARLAAGLTQAEVAIRAGIPASHLSRIENGVEPRVDTQLAIAQAIGVDHAELFTVESAA